MNRKGLAPGGRLFGGTGTTLQPSRVSNGEAGRVRVSPGR
jgi:hypothetical protein